MMLGSMDSALPPKSERQQISLRKSLRQLSLGQDPLPVSPLISTRNLVPGLSESVVKLDRLGKGATSNVFRAVHAATLKMVALKEVTVTTEADRRAVRTEMRALGTQRSPLLTSTFTTEVASCPRIVEYYGSVLRENGNACIAVEYVAGGSLGSWLDGGCRCPEAWIAHIAYQALEALDFVHSCGRVHRDVKPANLLITRNGDLKLADFGAAGLENSSRMVGTQRFMAPERLKGRRASAQSDLWSLGLSLGTAVLGDDFMSQASTEFEQLDLARKARSTLAQATTISTELTDFLHQCLSRDPARRPALRNLMKHPFLKNRRGWASKCPEVKLSMKLRKRQQREEVHAIGTDAVLRALCQARADDNLIGSRVDPEVAADLAFELGVTPKSLVRNVEKRTCKLIRRRGGGTAGVSDSGGDDEDTRSLRSGYSGGLMGGGIASDAARRRRRKRELRGASCLEEEKWEGDTAVDANRSVGDGRVSLNLCEISESSLSPSGSPPAPEIERPQAIGQGAPIATVGDSSADHPARSPGTPNSRVVKTTGELSTAGGSTATPFRNRNNGASSRKGSRRAVEMSSAVRLTPHKRRGEKRASKMMKHGPGCEADVARRSRGRRERARGTHSAGELGAQAQDSVQKGISSGNVGEILESESHDDGQDGGHVRESGRGFGRRSLPGQRKAVEKPRTATSRTLPSRTDVSQRTMRGVYQLADEMRAEMTVSDRIHRFRVYPGCFSGREAVQWMLDGSHASSRFEAEKLGNEMMKASAFQHILNSHMFEDSCVYYQFIDDKAPPPPARGGRRLRQIARVVRKQVARKLVPSGGGAGTGAHAGGVETRAGAGHGSGNLDGTRTVEGSDSGHSIEGPSMSSSTESSSGRGAPVVGCSERYPSIGDTGHHGSGKNGRETLPPRLPQSSSLERSKHRRGRHKRKAGKSQLRRFSSSMSTATVPETPY